MRNDEFLIWLKGYLDLAGLEKPLNDRQMIVIHSHIQLTETIENYLNAKIRLIRRKILRALNEGATGCTVKETKAIYDLIF